MSSRAPVWIACPWVILGRPSSSSGCLHSPWLHGEARLDRLGLTVRPSPAHRAPLMQTDMTYHHAPSARHLSFSPSPTRPSVSPSSPRRKLAQSSLSLSRRPHAVVVKAESEDSQHPASSFIVTCNKVSSNSDPCLPWLAPQILRHQACDVAASSRRTLFCTSAPDGISYLSRSSRLPPTPAPLRRARRLPPSSSPSLQDSSLPFR